MIYSTTDNIVYADPMHEYALKFCRNHRVAIGVNWGLGSTEVFMQDPKGRHTRRIVSSFNTVEEVKTILEEMFIELNSNASNASNALSALDCVEGWVDE